MLMLLVQKYAPVEVAERRRKSSVEQMLPVGQPLRVSSAAYRLWRGLPLTQISCHIMSEGVLSFPAPRFEGKVDSCSRVVRLQVIRTQADMASPALMRSPLITHIRPHPHNGDTAPKDSTALHKVGASW
jgi:hypothetical protein